MKEQSIIEVETPGHGREALEACPGEGIWLLPRLYLYGLAHGDFDLALQGLPGAAA